MLRWKQWEKSCSTLQDDVLKISADWLMCDQSNHFCAVRIENMARVDIYSKNPSVKMSANKCQGERLKNKSAARVMEISKNPKTNWILHIVAQQPRELRLLSNQHPEAGQLTHLTATSLVQALDPVNWSLLRRPPVNPGGTHVGSASLVSVSLDLGHWCMTCLGSLMYACIMCLTMTAWLLYAC